METLLIDVIIILGLSVIVLLLGHRLGVPSIVGFLFTGILCGPHGLRLVYEIDQVETLADIGLVLLLFTIGMEFSLSKIFQYKRYFLLGGTLQFCLTVFSGISIALVVGRPWNEALFLGFLLTLSSTAIVLRLLDQRGESDTPHGHLTLGILIFQDIAVVPMMLLVPILAGKGADVDDSIYLILLKGVGLLVLVITGAKYFVPKLLYYITKTRSRELFLLTVLTICFSVAWITNSMGLSLSLGAFLAGLTVSDTDYKNEAIGDIVPFQDLFISFFFVSIGMLLDVTLLLQQPLTIVLITVGILILKSFTGGISAILVGMPLRTAVLSGVMLSQVGEFSFVLAKVGRQSGISSKDYHQLFLAVSLLSMAVTPFLFKNAYRIAQLFLRLPLPIRLKSGLRPLETRKHPALSNHIIIIGFGLSGRNLARSAAETSIPYTILEMNPETVRKERKNREPIHFGDATHEPVLNHVNVTEATALAVLINDSVAATRIVELARRLNPRIYIIVRTRYIQECSKMYSLGADDVIPDEFGSSVEVFSRVLEKYQIAREEIEKFVAKLREESYEMLRHLFREPGYVMQYPTGVPDVVLENFRLHRNSSFNGKRLSDLNLRKNYGTTIVLIRRNNESVQNISGETILLEGDIIVAVGSYENLMRCAKVFRGQEGDT